MKLFSYIFFALILTISACKSTKLVNPGEPINVTYQRGVDLYEKNNYTDAAEIFEAVTRMGRGTNYAQDAQFYLAESYYKDGKYILAEAEFARFTSFYPRDERREMADFKKAMSLYQQSPRYRLDQSATHKAIEEFQLFNSRYPNSDLVTESADRINELREKLALKYFESAEFYARTDQFKAATIYYDLVIDRYPESKWTEQALLNKISTFIAYADNSVLTKQVERYNEAISTYETFIQLFPQSSNRKKAEELRDDAEKGINAARKDLLEIDNLQSN